MGAPCRCRRSSSASPFGSPTSSLWLLATAATTIATSPTLAPTAAPFPCDCQDNNQELTASLARQGVTGGIAFLCGNCEQNCTTLSELCSTTSTMSQNIAAAGHSARLPEIVAGFNCVCGQTCSLSCAPFPVPTNTRSPTRPPTNSPTNSPTRSPTRSPSPSPSPTRQPTRTPTSQAPSNPGATPRPSTHSPTAIPTTPPIARPTDQPTDQPTSTAPTNAGVTVGPSTRGPTGVPTTTATPTTTPTAPTPPSPTAVPTPVAATSAAGGSSGGSTGVVVGAVVGVLLVIALLAAVVVRRRGGEGEGKVGEPVIVGYTPRANKTASPAGRRMSFPADNEYEYNDAVSVLAPSSNPKPSRSKKKGTAVVTNPAVATRSAPRYEVPIGSPGDVSPSQQEYAAVDYSELGGSSSEANYEAVPYATPQGSARYQTVTGGQNAYLVPGQDVNSGDQVYLTPGQDVNGSEVYLIPGQHVNGGITEEQVYLTPGQVADDDGEDDGVSNPTLRRNPSYAGPVEAQYSAPGSLVADFC
eukprot:m.14658 g.14658  ORF g.14658 m.14658 type:complete len:527 (-) comp4810_c0_seq1:139-1719(-)